MSRKENKLDLNGVLYVVIGVLFCVFQSEVLKLLFMVVGALFIAKGVLDLLAHSNVSGVINLVIGIFLIVGSMTIVQVMLIVFGVLMLLNGLRALLALSKCKPTVSQLLGALFTVLVGVLLMVSHWLMINWFFIILGVIFIVNGALVLTGDIRR